jgi:hypothetical protein
MVGVMSGIKPVYVVEMSLAEWTALPTHPRQRSVERHAKARHWRVAATASGAVAAVLRQVVAAELNGRLWKVDGHTRTQLWQEGRLPAPETVNVTVYRVRDEAELLTLYGAFDAASAAEQPADKIWGAYRQHDLAVTSNRLRRGLIGTALGIALQGRKYRPPNKGGTLDVYDAVGYFRDELLIIDGLAVDSKVYPSGVLAAALLALSLYPEQIEFWRMVSRREGTKQQGLMDPVEAVLEEVNELRTSRKGLQVGKQVELAGRTMRGYLAWLNREQEKNQYWFSNRLREIELDPYIAEVKALKGIPS